VQVVLATEAPRTGPTKPARADKPTERRGSLAALAVDVPKITQAGESGRGFAEAGAITHWAEIIGPDLARGCQPDLLRFHQGRAP